nr:immunoglobulin light chain junction region [Macaca mulatta]MPN81600.1 immunoglobulin light chain junction region [Macaca mulatta]MPN81857.1 immunoglobulin light chain junction region [Macaca mulatta]MPN81934.1 immunoglobulin light chain junction region [Macaca mulatta]MPN82124.1 immunoglobulin light chain junction region [Macaca mulatta]
CQQYNSNPRTF